MSRRVLLTGSTGFVGRQVLGALREEPVAIRLAVRENRARNGLLDSPDLEVVESADIFSESPDWWASVCSDVDTVIHVAWYAEPGKYLESPKNLDCLSGTLTLAKACAQAGVRHFVGVGTCFEYDLEGGLLSVDTPLKPETLYGSAKAATYLSLARYFSGLGMEFSWCRLFYLYGEGEDERRLTAYIRARLSRGEPADLSSGRQVRDFLDVKDAGVAIARVALGSGRGAVNICSGQGVSVRELAERIADDFGRRDLLRFGARPDNANEPPFIVGVLTGGDA
ncbi:NAD(P)-dependent oxidoreductase [Pseudomonas sp. BN415]|uniref:NAD-dependent epimerase/dehydratase family protein n=1 Tax=Pseudomonas sp. BN415 TaxID=2567889 RepID=UPI002457D7DD|nr:NAD(P)-dependent oxidoreductase [Pseudomonas sp. BN415]MDH4581050.1 NAD(P)-dependent oxidoreductase [Pseudomonas sp. BN415]